MVWLPDAFDGAAATSEEPALAADLEVSNSDNRGRQSMIRILVAATIAGSVLIATAGAASAAPTTGVTAKTITIGQVDTLSGPVPGLFEGAKDGTQAYVDYVNAHGGVNGRKLLLQVDDDQFDAGKYATATQALVNTSFALVGGFSLFDAAGVPYINAAKIPDVSFSLSTQREEDPYNYSPNPIYPDGSRLGPYKYYKSVYGKSAVQHSATFDASVASAESQTQADVAAMESIGYKFVYQRTVNPLDSDFTSDVIKMRDAGVQIVYIVGLSVGQVADMAQNMAEQGFHPKLFSTSGVAYDSTYIPSAGSAANNTYSDMQSVMYGGQDAKNTPAVALFDKWVKKVNPSAPLDVYGVYGWSAAEMFVQALKAAGPNPTRPEVIDQLNKITSFNAGGLLATSNPAEKIPPTCWLLVKVSNGKWVRTGPSPKTGFICSPGGYHPTPKPYHRPPGA